MRREQRSLRLGNRADSDEENAMTQPRKLLASRLALPLVSGFAWPAATRDDGQTLAEYALILALIAILVVGAIFFLQTQITSLFSNIGNNL
jgi:Flp pilus assembly pilin Flp